ncbi:hypothetical protein [Elizabethkingia anophelis]|uniref:hypothetical protein n=1 Tax=Elizabethkingia anophelis TaxID=1117645 RepID=UPI003892A6F6
MKALFNKLRKSKYKMDYYGVRNTMCPLKKSRLRRALKKKVNRDLSKQLETE